MERENETEKCMHEIVLTLRNSKGESVYNHKEYQALPLSFRYPRSLFPFKYLKNKYLKIYV
jgi:hypothetical protein